MCTEFGKPSYILYSAFKRRYMYATIMGNAVIALTTKRPVDKEFEPLI